jgi:hypothetical protein
MPFMATATGKRCPACNLDIGVWPIVKGSMSLTDNSFQCPHCGTKLSYAGKGMHEVFGAAIGGCTVIVVLVLIFGILFRRDADEVEVIVLMVGMGLLLPTAAMFGSALYLRKGSTVITEPGDPPVTLLSGWLFGMALGAALGVLPFCLALVSAGAGHGHYLAAWLFFPWAMLIGLADGSIGVVAVSVALVQFPLYGLAIGYCGQKGKAAFTACMIGLLHLMGIGATYLIGHGIFS